MKITTDTADSLAAKLATLDLTDEEGVLLTTLIESDEGEVTGFNFEEIKVTFAPRVIGPLPKRWKAAEGESYTEVEWTYVVTQDLQDW